MPKTIKKKNLVRVLAFGTGSLLILFIVWFGIWMTVNVRAIDRMLALHYSLYSQSEKVESSRNYDGSLLTIVVKGELVDSLTGDDSKPVSDFEVAEESARRLLPERKVSTKTLSLFGFQRVETLQLYCVTISPSLAKEIRHSQRLETLSIKGCDIDLESFRELLKSKSIKNLVYGPSSSKIQYLPLLVGSSVESLQYNSNGDLDLSELSALADCNSVQRLSLRCKGGIYAEQLRSNQNVTTFRLANNYFPGISDDLDSDAAPVSQVMVPLVNSFPSLEKLILENIDFQQASGPIVSLDQLKTVVLIDCSLSESDYDIFENLAQKPLEEVQIDYQEYLPDVAIFATCQLDSKVVDLSRCQIRESDFANVKLRKGQVIKVASRFFDPPLSLGSSKITSSGALIKVVRP